MTVWLVYHGEFEDRIVEGVYTSLEKARQRQAELQDFRTTMEPPEIEEEEVDVFGGGR